MTDLSKYEIPKLEFKLNEYGEYVAKTGNLQYFIRKSGLSEGFYCQNLFDHDASTFDDELPTFEECVSKLQSHYEQFVLSLLREKV
jgi:hypothetical protein